MEKITALEFFKNWNRYSSFERKKMIYDFTDKLNPYLVDAFCEEYEEFRSNLPLELARLSVLQQETFTPPKITEEGDFIRIEYYYDKPPTGGVIEHLANTFEIDRVIDVLDESVNPEPEPLDLSDTSAVEKIIYLNELGIIDFLRTKAKAGISNGGLASVLSGITGVKPETIKPSLNRLSNNDIADKNHPYSTQKTVDKIKVFLTKLGF